MIAQQLRAQGAQNATANLTIQFDNMDITMTNEVIDASYTSNNGTALAMPAGTFAALPWIPKQNREGMGDYDSYVGGWGTFPDPFGLTVTDLDANGKAVQNPLMYFAARRLHLSGCG